MGLVYAVIVAEALLLDVLFFKLHLAQLLIN